MPAAGAVLRCAEMATLGAAFLLQPLSAEPDASQAVRLLSVLLNGLSLAAGAACPPGAAETLRASTSVYLLFSAAFWWHRVALAGAAELSSRHRACVPDGPGCSSARWLPAPRDLPAASSLAAAALFAIDFVRSRRLHRRHRVTSVGGVALAAQVAACASVAAALRDSPACGSQLAAWAGLAAAWLALAASSVALLRHHGEDASEEEVEEAVAADAHVRTSDVEEVWVARLALCGHSAAAVLLVALGREGVRPCPPSVLCLHGVAGAVALGRLVGASLAAAKTHSPRGR